jgi:peptidoglycan hydrolase CwlO-like protein
MGALMNNITSTENRVRHAEQGYSGISADYNIREDELTTLYDWDLNLIADIENLSSSVSDLQSTIDQGNSEAIGKKISDVETEIRTFNSLFDKRIKTIANLGI